MLDVKWKTSGNNQCTIRYQGKHLFYQDILCVFFCLSKVQTKKTCIKFCGKGHGKPDVNGQKFIKDSFVPYGNFSVFL